MVHGYDIKTCVDYFRKLLDEREDFLKNQSSARHGINYAITGWQLHDWVFAEKKKYPFMSQFATKKDFQKYLRNNWVGFKNLHDLADGAKHFELTYRQTNIVDTMVANWHALLRNDPEFPDSTPQLFFTYKVAGLVTILPFFVLMEGITWFWFRFFKNELGENVEVILVNGYTPDLF